MAESRGRIAVIGAGPGGMAAALALFRQGFEVSIYERFAEVKAAGNILNLWPPPQKVLKIIGVDTTDLGAPCHTIFANAKGRLRADVRLPAEVEEEYGGGFIGLLRWGLYQRMLAALPEGVLRLSHNLTGLEDLGETVKLTFEGREPVVADLVIGADGINSSVRKSLWGDTPIRRQFLHLVGGWLYDEGGASGEGVIAHNRTTQVSYTPIRHEGRWGFEWWVLEAFRDRDPVPVDLLGFCQKRAVEFSPLVRELIDRTPVENMQRWEIRDRPPIRQWSRGRATLVGDAAHPTSPYAAYGAGMSIEDGYFLARELGVIDMHDTQAVKGALQAYEDRRKPHTAYVSQLAYKVGRMFHHLPGPLRPLRDQIFDRTPFLQRMVGDQMPAQILSQLAEIEESGQPMVRPLGLEPRTL
ncbi:NAD(P)/FAD-dependent oxidoreductase [Brevundimonas sp.]|uniref:FAD-dependent oxidoreductase n=1 Tax=Brevundimonas sp. TaxID=1871086 RepID=UPI001A32868C|nr:NAD(P)/FAD-dependent oxidoreductase [Brevundimonas sp.]MBJ7483400.1 FAD-dependent monooxygenase [Brevundimonas sp.]